MITRKNVKAIWAQSYKNHSKIFSLGLGYGLLMQLLSLIHIFAD